MDEQEFRAIRKQLGLTQAQLAEVLGFATPLAVSSMERKRWLRPVPCHVAMLMDAFDSGYRPPNWPEQRVDDTATDAQRLAEARRQIRRLNQTLWQSRMEMAMLKDEDRNRSRPDYMITAPLHGEIKELKAEIARMRLRLDDKDNAAET